MSHLPPQAIAEFQALWKKHYGVELPPEQAEIRANQVFAVLRLALEKPPSGSKRSYSDRSPEDEPSAAD